MIDPWYSFLRTDYFKHRFSHRVLIHPVSLLMLIRHVYMILNKDNSPENHRTMMNLATGVDFSRVLIGAYNHPVESQMRSEL